MNTNDTERVITLRAALVKIEIISRREDAAYEAMSDEDLLKLIASIAHEARWAINDEAPDVNAGRQDAGAHTPGSAKS